MKQGRITAEVISCPGQLGNTSFSALQLNVEGFESPYTLTLSLRAIGYQALSQQADPDTLFTAIARAVNAANVGVAMRPVQRSDR